MKTRKLSLVELQQLNSGTLPDEIRELIVVNEDTGDILVKVPSKKNQLPPIKDVVVNQLPDGTAEEFVQEVKIISNKKEGKKNVAKTTDTQEVQEETVQAELVSDKPAKEHKLTKKELAAKEQEAFLSNFQLLQWSGEKVHLVKMVDLVPIDTTPIADADIVMRNLNAQHLEHMKEGYKENPQSFPPIKVQYCQMYIDGQIVYKEIVADGYHRLQMYIDLLKDQIEEYISSQVAGKSMEDLEDYDVAEMLSSAMATQDISVEELNFLNPVELIKAAFTANFEHGLPATDASRSRYGMWLLEKATAAGQTMSRREAARQARVSHVALGKYIKHELKRRGQLEKMSDFFFVETHDDLAADEQAQQEETDAADAKSNKTEKAALAVLKNMAIVVKELEIDPASDDSIELLVKYLRSFAVTVPSEAYAAFGMAFQVLLKVKQNEEKEALKNREAATVK